MPESFESYAALLSRLMVLIPERSPQILGVEGYKGAGKSRLAKMLGHDLSAGVIGTDEFLLPRRGTKRQRYIDSIDLEGLLAKLDGELSVQSIVIIEGICLRDMLERMDHKADLTIYVDWCSPPLIRLQNVRDLSDWRRGRRFKTAFTNDHLEYCHRVQPYGTADLALIVLEESP